MPTDDVTLYRLQMQHYIENVQCSFISTSITVYSNRYYWILDIEQQYNNNNTAIPRDKAMIEEVQWCPFRARFGCWRLALNLKGIIVVFVHFQPANPSHTTPSSIQWWCTHHRLMPVSGMRISFRFVSFKLYVLPQEKYQFYASAFKCWISWQNDGRRLGGHNSATPTTMYLLPYHTRNPPTEKGSWWGARDEVVVNHWFLCQKCSDHCMNENYNSVSYDYFNEWRMPNEERI